VIIPPYLYLPLLVRHVNIGIEVHPWPISVNVTLRGVDAMFGVGWIQHRSSPAFNDVSIPEFRRTLMIALPSDIPESM
jgi:hypothetical protein